MMMMQQPQRRKRLFGWNNNNTNNKSHQNLDDISHQHHFVLNHHKNKLPQQPQKNEPAGLNRSTTASGWLTSTLQRVEEQLDRGLGGFFREASTAARGGAGGDQESVTSLGDEELDTLRSDLARADREFGDFDDDTQAPFGVVDAFQQPRLMQREESGILSEERQQHQGLRNAPAVASSSTTMQDFIRGLAWGLGGGVGRSSSHRPVAALQRSQSDSVSEQMQSFERRPTTVVSNGTRATLERAEADLNQSLEFIGRLDGTQAPQDMSNNSVQTFSSQPTEEGLASLQSSLARAEREFSSPRNLNRAQSLGSRPSAGDIVVHHESAPEDDDQTSVLTADDSIAAASEQADDSFRGEEAEAVSSEDIPVTPSPLQALSDSSDNDSDSDTPPAPPVLENFASPCCVASVWQDLPPTTVETKDSMDSTVQELLPASTVESAKDCQGQGEDTRFEKTEVRAGFWFVLFALFLASVILMAVLRQPSTPLQSMENHKIISSIPYEPLKSNEVNLGLQVADSDEQEVTFAAEEEQTVKTLEFFRSASIKSLQYQNVTTETAVSSSSTTRRKRFKRNTRMLVVDRSKDDGSRSQNSSNVAINQTEASTTRRSKLECLIRNTKASGSLNMSAPQLHWTSVISIRRENEDLFSCESLMQQQMMAGDNNNKKKNDFKLKPRGCNIPFLHKTQLISACGGESLGQE